MVPIRHSMEAVKTVSMAAARTMEPRQPLNTVAMTTNVKLASAVTRPETVLAGQPVLKILIVRRVSAAKPKSVAVLVHSARLALTQSNAVLIKSADSPTPA